MDKSFYKTATLIAASCKSAAVFSDVSEEVGHGPAVTECVSRQGHCVRVDWARRTAFTSACGADWLRAATQVKNAMFEYGRHLGLAFQVVDDILDFTQTSEQLGKPQVWRGS